MEEFERGCQNMKQCVLSGELFFWFVGRFAGRDYFFAVLKNNIGELVPDIMINFLARKVEAIIVHVSGDVFYKCAKFFEKFFVRILVDVFDAGFCYVCRI